MQELIDLFMNLHWAAVGQIIVIDILLGGDNAVVIALACRDLPVHQRRKGIALGVFCAISLRVVLITCAVFLLDLPFLKIVGGLLLLWIGTKLLIPEGDEEKDIAASTKLFQAVRTIVIADLVMSLDNVIAIAGAAQQAAEAHQTLLIVFGLVVSVPFIVCGSQIILTLLDRFPVIVWGGGALLGWVGGGMIATDSIFIAHIPSIIYWKTPLEIAGAVTVIIVGAAIRKLLNRRDKNLGL